MDEQELLIEIADTRRELGDRLFLLGHYYVRSEILDLCDTIGDSYALALAALNSNAEYIVFCGVRFMAESARILCRPEQRVFHPNRNAGCPLADFVTEESLKTFMNGCRKRGEPLPTPLLYINSTAAVKARCADYDGVCCTSSNAERLTRRLLGENRRVLILPDARIGQNLVSKVGLSDEETHLVKGDFSEPIPAEVKLLLWDGNCHVHQNFTVEQVENARKKFPGSRVLVHPECHEDVVRASDFSGSTKQILTEIENAAVNGETGALVIGTEYKFVQRAVEKFPEINVVPLHPSVCFNFDRITAESVLTTLRSIRDDEKPFGEVTLPLEITEKSRVVLKRMIDLVEG